MSRFFTAAASASSSASASSKALAQEEEDKNDGQGNYDAASTVICTFISRQECMEDTQDLVLYRGTYYFYDSNSRARKTMSSSQQEAAVLQQWSKIKKQQQQQQQQQQPQAKPPPECLVQTKQVYIAFWPATCLVGMVIVLLQFMVFYRGEGNGVINGMEWTQEGMTKHSAMLLALCYSAFAWTLSNGLIMNPRKNI